MSATLTLYTNPMSRGRIARWMLEETQTPYNTEWLEYGTTMKSPEYLAINPMGKVPAIRHDDTVVTETAAICAYLADAFPESNLAPAQNRRGEYYRWLFYSAGALEYAILNHALGMDPPAEKEGTVGYGSFTAVMDCLEHQLKGNDYITGSEFSAADVYLGSQIGFGLAFDSIEKRPVFEEYHTRVTDRDAYRRAVEIDDAAIPKTK